MGVIPPLPLPSLCSISSSTSQASRGKERGVREFEGKVGGREGVFETQKRLGPGQRLGMKLDANVLRYLSKDDFRVLTAVEQGQRNVSFFDMFL